MIKRYSSSTVLQIEHFRSLIGLLRIPVLTHNVTSGLVMTHEA